jgi:hypothetical protein
MSKGSLGIRAALAALVIMGCSGGEARTVELPMPPALGSAALFPPPELKKTVAAPTPPFRPKDPSLVFVLGKDFGLRSDDGGKGHFLAPRAHGRHNGIDLLAPVGTPLLAACTGRARSDDRGGYGRVVQVVCALPDALGGDEGLHASFFYAHLDQTLVPKRWTPVRAGQKVGTVGKTGNAAGPKIRPHVHLELIVRASEEEALEERHAGGLPEANAAADRFFELLEAECTTPARLRAHAGEIRRERRADPYVVLMCGGKPKPELAEPEDHVLKAAQSRWSQHYTAEGFDVDLGPR